MADENKKNRINDKRAPGKLQWEGQSEAERQERVKTAVRLESELASVGAAFLAHMGTGIGIAAIPHTGPAQYVVAGTMAAIGKVLGEQMPSSGDLTDERISELHDSMFPAVAFDRDKIMGNVVRFTRAAIAAALASQSQAAQPTGDFPALPSPFMDLWSPTVRKAWEIQMHDYARTAIAAHIAGTSQATKVQAEPIYQTMEGEFGEHWGDVDKAGYDAANEQGITTRIVYSAPIEKEAPAVLEGATNCTLNGGDANGNQVFVSMDSKPSTHLWTVGGRAYLCEAGPVASVAKEAALHNVRPGVPTASQVQADEAELYRTLTGDAMALGFDSITAALGALRKVKDSPAVQSETGAQASADGIEQLPDLMDEWATAPRGEAASAVYKRIVKAIDSHFRATTTSTVTMGEAFKAVGGWMNGGELGYPSFGSMNALWAYTVKMARSYAENTQAAPTVEYVPIAVDSRDEAGGSHPNDTTPADNECQKALDARGDDSGQGLSPYWKWGFRAGWHDHKRLAARSSTEGAQKAPEEVRNQVLAEVEEAVDQVISEAEDAHEPAESVGAYRCREAIRALRTSSTDTGSAA